jgi:hypothetical protein
MRKRWLLGVIAMAVAVGLVAAERHEVLRFAISEGASLASGYTVRLTDQRIGIDRATLYGVALSHRDEPLLDASRVDIRYSLRDLFPGSRHRFGLTGIDIANAKLTIVKFPDGSYNFIIPSGGPPQAHVPLPVNNVPIRFALHMHDASLELREPKAYDPSAKLVRVRDFNVDASIDSANRTQYRARGVFAQRTDEPFTIAGLIDAQRSFAMHHARAVRFPLRALANYFADTPVVRILAGQAKNFDARLYSLEVAPNAATSYHVNLNLDVYDGRLALSSLAEPLENIRGHLQLVDNAFFLRRVDGTLAGIPLRVTGGIYDLTGQLTGGAKLRLGISGTGDLRNLRHAFSFTRDQPISGRIALGILVEGPIENPLIVAQGKAARTTYRQMPFTSLGAGIVYHDNLIAYAPLHAYYGGVEIGIRGTMTLGKHVHSELAVHVNATADRLPYLDDMLAREPILVDAAATGDDLLFRLQGAAASARGVERVATLFQLGEDGRASVDPFWFHTPRGDFEGGYILDRPDDSSGFWAMGGNLEMRTPKSTTFPGISLPSIPQIDGRIANVSVAGGATGKQIVLAGLLRGDRSSIADVPFTHIEAAFSGTLANAAVNLLHAAGPWGTFDGNGAFSSQAFVARGRYRGTFEGLQPFLGSAIPGHGALAGTAGIAVEGNRVIVQGVDLAMRHATLHGIPIDHAGITLSVQGPNLRVYSAHARAAGGDVVAAGTFSSATLASNSKALALTVRDLDAVQLHGIGLPFDAGRLWASGDLSPGAPIPTFEGGVAIARGHMQQYAISGDGDVHLAGDAAHLDRMLASLGPSFGFVNGDIGSLSSGSPSYALNTDVPAGPVAATLHALGFPTYETDGTFNARLRLGGRGVAPSVTGSVGVPAGDVNGLAFVDGAAALAADTSGVSVGNGSVLVGTTFAGFSAIQRSDENEVRVVATHARLEDFDNFFDTGDTLDGSGGVRLAAAAQRGRLTTSGDIDLRAFRYRNFPVGDTRAIWSSARNVVRGSLLVGGNEGILNARGSIGVATAGNFKSALMRSRYDLTAGITHVDLSFWVPALGFYSVPVTGRASGEATIRGTFPFAQLRASGEVDEGTLGPLALQTAKFNLHSVARRISLDDAELVTPGLNASARGTFGLRPKDPVDLQVQAATQDLPELMYRVARVRLPVSGSFESTLSIGGTTSAPTFAAGVDGSNVQAYGIAIPSLFGEVRLNGNKLVVSNAGASFTRGEATLAGSLPLELSPLRLGPPTQPMSFDVDVIDLDPGILDALLGSNSKLTGAIDGHFGLSGTAGEPIVLGHASLSNGSYVSDLERVPITHAAGTLAFNRTSATFSQVSAQLGAGNVAGSGSAQFGRGHRAVSFVAKMLAKDAQLDLPAYGSGTVDADLALTKTPSSEALLSGEATVSNATLPFAAFVNVAQNASGRAAPPLALAFDLRATAGKNVRVRGNGYGAGLDIGAVGSVHLGGTLRSPTLDGGFQSSGGTLTYFDRAFRVQQASVTFDPSGGLLPAIHAVGTTSVVNPDPDRARNPYGTAQITITVDGQIENLKIAFNTIPSGYTREQVIAMLAPFGGFLGGIAYNNASALQVQSPGGITPLGALNPVPGIYDLQRNGTITVGQEAFNLLNAQFTAGLLAPVESALGQGLGLSNVNLTLGYYGNVGVQATRVLGKAVSAVYATTFGLPQVQSFGVQIQSSEYTSATLSFFYQNGPTRILATPSSTAFGYNQDQLLGQPIFGTSGFSFKLQRYF